MRNLRVHLALGTRMQNVLKEIIFPFETGKGRESLSREKQRRENKQKQNR